MTDQPATAQAATTQGTAGTRRRKLPAKYNAVVLPAVLALFMTCIVSLISTLKVTGMGGFGLGNWLQAWALSYAIAFPTLLVVLPFVRRLVATIVEPPGR